MENANGIKDHSAPTQACLNACARTKKTYPGKVHIYNNIDVFKYFAQVTQCNLLKRLFLHHTVHMTTITIHTKVEYFQMLSATDFTSYSYQIFFVNNLIIIIIPYY